MRILLATIVVFTCALFTNVYASPPAVINGTASVNAGQTYTYSYDRGSLIMQPHWILDPKGRLISTWQSGTIYYCSVEWLSGGSSILTIASDDLPYAQKTITISAPFVAVPSTTFTVVQTCDKTVVKRTSAPPANNDWWWQTSSSGTGYTLGKADSIVLTAAATTLYLRAQYSLSPFNWSATPQSAGSIAVIMTPLAPTASTGVTTFVNNSATVSVSAVTGATAYAWYTVSSAGSPITSATTSSYTVPVTATQTYYVSALNGVCESAGRKAVTITGEPLPVISRPANNGLTMGDAVTLSASGTYQSYSWRDQANAVVGTQAQLTTSNAANYNLIVTKTGVSGSGKSKTESVNYGPIGQKVNYVAVNEMQVAITTANSIYQQDEFQIRQSVQYFDGLGRPLQAITTQGSPGKLDVVQPVAYDAYGREGRKYLPFTARSDGWYKPQSDIIAASGAYQGIAQPFYATTGPADVADDVTPYSQIIYEASPLSRPLKEYGVGAAWSATSANKYVSYQYLYNIHNTGNVMTGEKIFHWKVNASGLPEKAASLNGYVETGGYYSSAQLSLKIATDENGSQVREYTNKSGQIILKKVQVLSGVTSLNSTTHWALTYYIYDEYNNLRFVFQPVLSKSIHEGATTFDLAGGAFCYKYDSRNRMIEKQVPGTSAVYMVYDDLDRIVMTQDGELRKTNQWLVNKYDRLNRPVLTAIYQHGSLISQVSMQGLISATLFYESYNGSATMHGYTSLVFPALTTSNSTVLTVTYYDAYTFKTLIGNTAYDYLGTHLTGQEATEFYQTAGTSKRIEGQVTGTKVNILGTSNYLWSVNYFDRKYRLIQNIRGNHKGGVDRTTNRYDFVKLVESRATHTKGSSPLVANRKFYYDHSARLSYTGHKFATEASIGTTSEVILSKNQYNELGQLVTKQTHSRDQGATFSNQTSYRYSIRGWLTEITDPLFSFKLKYETPVVGGTAPQYNGNISETAWTTVGQDASAYAYQYDAMNRLVEAAYFNTSRSANNGRFTERIGSTPSANDGYDLNGNILKLMRYGKNGTSTFGLMDNLGYTYSGNQLTRVDDAVTLASDEVGFKELSKAANEYGTYDANGSITKDANKGVTLIQYNYLNLPKRVEKSATEYLTYTYDATGTKLAQQVFGPAPKTTDYIGEFIYENDVLQFASHEEGRIVPDNSAGAVRPWEYQYFLKDHLGNVRVTFSEKKTSATYSATLEATTQANEQSTFKGYGNRSNFNLFDHTDAGTASTYSQLLTGGSNSQVGLSKSFQVNNGDIVDLEVFAKFEAPSATPASPGSLLTSLVSAFNLSSAGATPVDGQQALTAFNANFSPGPIVGRTVPYESGGAPRAYLNYILFDENFVLKDFGFDQIGVSAQQNGAVPVVPHDYLSLHVKVKAKGFLYVYLSNEQPFQTNVYFDDLKITYTAGVESTDDYYPFGLVFNSYTRENATPQEFKFNGKEEQTELSLGWLDYGARMYQPELGKFFTQDRFSEKYFALSPYQYAAGNPLKFVDINGDSTYLVIYGAGYTNIRNEGSAHDNGRNFQKNAMALKKQIEGREGFDSERDQVVVVEARSTEQFTDATNKEYETGKIASLTVFSHGTEGSISLGGERGNYDQLDDYDQREINFKTVDKIDKNNFEKTAGVTLYGCNIGSGGETSFAQTMANSLQLTVKAFDGSAEAKSQNRDGKAPLVFDGTMIRTKDRSTQRVQLSIFTPK